MHATHQSICVQVSRLLSASSLAASAFWRYHDMAVPRPYFCQDARLVCGKVSGHELRARLSQPVMHSEICKPSHELNCALTIVSLGDVACLDFGRPSVHVPAVPVWAAPECHLQASLLLSALQKASLPMYGWVSLYQDKLETRIEPCKSEYGIDTIQGSTSVQISNFEVQQPQHFML